jgi:hypothetical protein
MGDRGRLPYLSDALEATPGAARTFARKVIDEQNTPGVDRDE